MKKHVVSIIAAIFTLQAVAQENDPNNAFNQAQLVSAPDTISGSINPSGDRDCFQVNVSECGTLDIYAYSIPGAVEVVLEVYASDTTTLLASNSIGGGTDTDVAAQVLVSPGTYYFRLRDETDTQSSVDGYILEVAFDGGDDCECNQTFSQACLLPFDTVGYEGKIFGSNLSYTVPNDRDCFVVNVSECGTLDIYAYSIPGAVEVVLEVYASDTTTLLASNSIGGGTDTDVAAQVLVTPGTYYFRLRDESDSQTSSNGYLLNLTFDGSDDCECNQTFSQACLLPIDTVGYEGKIFGSNLSYSVANDRDCFMVNVNECGTLAIYAYDIPSVVEVVLEVYASDTTTLLASNSIGGGTDTDVAAQVLVSPGTYYFRLRDETDSQTSSNGYLLNLTFDGSDGCECNQTFSQACLLPIDTVGYEGKIFGSNLSYSVANDRDCFMVNVNECGTLAIYAYDIPSVVEVVLEVYASDTTTLLASNSIGGGTDTDVAAQVLVSPGTYYFRLRDETDSQTSSNGYIMNLGFTPDPIDVSLSQSGILLSATASGANYQWLDCSNGYSIIPGATSQSFTPNTNGLYAVEISVGVCADTSACINVTGVGVDEMALGGPIDVFPNPAMDQIFLHSASSANLVKASVLDAFGRQVLQQTLSPSTRVIVDIGDLAPGSYALHVQLSDGSIAVRRFQKQ